MTEDEFNSAFQAGYERVEHYVKQGINLFPLVKWDLVIRRLLPVCCLP